MSKVIFVEYCAADFLGGTVNMDPLTELAYRRICDMIYSTNDKLIDNDSLKYSTKTGAKWKKIRQELINLGKIFIEDGYIRNKKCEEKIAKSRKNIEQKRVAQAAMIESRNALKDKETTLAAASAAALANQKPKNPSSKKKKINKKEKEDFEEFWNVCPRKVGKGKAEEKYAVALQEATHDELMRAMRAHASEMNGKDREFIPHPATWLHQKRWFDETAIQHEGMDDWPDWKKNLSGRIGVAAVKSWFSGADFDGVVLAVKTKFQADYVSANFLEDVRAVLGNACEIEIRKDRPDEPKQTR